MSAIKTDREPTELTEEALDQVAGGWASYIAVMSAAQSDDLAGTKMTKSEAAKKSPILD